MKHSTAHNASSWNRPTGGIKRPSGAIGQAISDLVMRGPLSPERIVEIEETLIRADLGVDVAARLATIMGEGRYRNLDEATAVLIAEVEKVLTPVARPLAVTGAKPFVVLVVGVNGSGKTTTIGKLAARFRAEGRSVMLAAGDTFRAAAIEQLKIWGSRVGAPVIAREQGADAAGLAFDALQAAKTQGADLLLVDAAVPHAVLLVLDATVGQNALSQVDVFLKIAGVTGLAMTKLDGTARGGILVAIAEKYRLPVHFIGVGESVDDLAPFAAKDFARAIAGFA